MKKLTKLLAATAVGMAALGSAQAQTATTTFQVTANVLESCSVAATNLAFGDYSASLGTDAGFDEHHHGDLLERAWPTT